MKTNILGHRGAMGDRPENSAISFKKALSDGADGIEFDVHLTSDGVPVVIHDEKVDRTTNGSGLISKMTFQEIKELDIVFKQGQIQNKKEKILSLEETLELTASESKLINIELKQGPVIYPGLEEKVVELIKSFNIEDKVIISSFNHYSIKMLKDIYPDIECGLLYMAGIYQPWVYARRLGVEAIHPFLASINEELVQACHENNILVNVFGANDSASISKMLSIGVDCIITDYPGLAVGLRELGE